MLTVTNYTINPILLQEAMGHLPEAGMKTIINQPTGNFFYDLWELRQEYKGTVWETIYNSLPVDKGEARIIVLNPGQCYQSHADIDDRYHLNITGEECFLIDLMHKTLHKLDQDGIWYDMNAGHTHTATNFGRVDRIQLVVRKLLGRNQIESPIVIKLVSKLDNSDDSRFLFDKHISPWLNSANKSRVITDFERSTSYIRFKILPSQLENFKNNLPEGFVIE
jgi:hypothetical protein